MPRHSAVDPGALLARSHRSHSGLRVRLRLTHRSDAPLVRALLARRGVEATDLQVSSLVRADPRERVVICATAPGGGPDAFLGVGAIAFPGDGTPDTLVADPGVAELLDDALREVVRRRALRAA